MIKIENILDDGTVTSPLGIRAASMHAGFHKDPNRLDLALVVAEGDDPVAAGAFTQNLFAAAPVQVSREALLDGHARAVVLNSGIANAATGEDGIQAARITQDAIACAIGCNKDKVLVASTGVIGEKLATQPFVEGAEALVASLSNSTEAGHNAARAIMTTDTHTKECAVSFTANGHRYTVGGMAKGSGMIAPNMATMLAVITCDMPMTPQVAHQALLENVKLSFNKVSVDSDTSTNDSVFFISSGAARGPVLDTKLNMNPIGRLRRAAMRANHQVKLGEGILKKVKAGELETAIQDSSYEAADANFADIFAEQGPVNPYAAFSEALYFVCMRLARMIASDGEGATKLVTVSVRGAASEADADACARTVAGSLLVKTAIAGRDCNWGRVVAALGRSGATFHPDKVDIDIVGLAVMRDGLPVKFNEQDALHYLTTNKEIEININLHAGNFTSWMWTCDLTHDYVTINADYRT